MDTRGRKSAYEEKHRTAVINNCWEFLDNCFKQAKERKDEKRQMELARILLPAVIKTIPQENINKNTNETVISISDEDRKVVQEFLKGFSKNLKC